MGSYLSFHSLTTDFDTQNMISRYLDMIPRYLDMIPRITTTTKEVLHILHLAPDAAPTTGSFFSCNFNINHLFLIPRNHLI